MAERTYNPKLGEGTQLIKTKKRYWELDFLRGLCVLLMVMDHFFFSAGEIMPYAWSWSKEFWTGLNEFALIYWYNNVRNTIRFVVVAMFFILCGISCTLSRNNLVRGLKTVCVALVITMVTWLADQFLDAGMLIVFGVIHMLGIAMLMYGLIDLVGWLIQSLITPAKDADKKPKRTKVALWIRKMLPALVGIGGLLAFFLIPLGHFGTDFGTVVIDGEYVDFYYTNLFTDVSASGGNFVKTILYFFIDNTPSQFSSADYFPVLPNAFMVLAGGAIGQLFYRTKARDSVGRLCTRAFTFILAQRFYYATKDSRDKRNKQLQASTFKPNKDNGQEFTNNIYKNNGQEFTCSNLLHNRNEDKAQEFTDKYNNQKESDSPDNHGKGLFAVAKSWADSFAGFCLFALGWIVYFFACICKANKPVRFVGRHALLFYLLHQIVIVAFFFAVGGLYYLF